MRVTACGSFAGHFFILMSRALISAVIEMSFGPELVWFWRREIEASFCGKRVQRVDGGNNSAIISFGQAELLLSWDSAHCGAAVVSQKERKNFLSSATHMPQITNALRSHLVGAEFFSADQLRRDRILKLSFRKTVGAGFSVVRYVFFELMERFSNLLITDEKGTIIETAKHIHPSDNAFRSILPGLSYSMPPLFEGISLEEWLASPRASEINRIAGFGKKLLGALSEQPLDVSERFLRAFYSSNEADIEFIPQALGNYITVLPGLLPGAARLPKGGSGTAAVLAPLRCAAFDARRRRVLSLLEKEILRRERQRADINALIAGRGAERFKQYGELITANLWQIKPGAREAELSGYGKDGGVYSLSVPLIAGVSPQKCAEIYFSKYKKIRSAAERAAALLPRIEEELAGYAETLEAARAVTDAGSLVMIEEEIGAIKPAAGRKNARAKKKEQLPPHLRFEFDGAIVFAGLSAKGNRYVTFKLANSDDIWFHAEGVPGSHVILRHSAALSAKERGDLLDFCASLAVFYSKAKEASRWRVDYTERKYVSPIRGGVANVTYKEFSSIAGSGAYWREYLEEWKKDS